MDLRFADPGRGRVFSNAFFGERLLSSWAAAGLRASFSSSLDQRADEMIPFRMADRWSLNREA